MTTWTYDVTITGSVAQPVSPGSSGARFQRRGQLVVTDQILDPAGVTNGRNLLEVGLTSNDLSGLQLTNGLGSITFATNNALVGRRSRDNVFESLNSQTNTLLIQPDRRGGQNSVNNFASGGFSVPYQIQDGLMTVGFQNNSVFGSINFSGSLSATYNATFSGVLTGIT